MQAALARRFIDDAIAFSHSPAANLRFYAARGARGLETGLQGSLHTEAAELLGLHNVAHIPGRQGLTQVSMGKSAQLAAGYYPGTGCGDSAVPTRRSGLARSQSGC